MRPADRDRYDPRGVASKVEPYQVRRLAVRVWGQRVALLALLSVLLLFPKALLALSEAWFAVLFLLWMPSFAALWLAYLYTPCPSCGRPFFVEGDPSSGSWLVEMRSGIRPFGSSCANCGLSLARGARHPTRRSS